MVVAKRAGAHIGALRRPQHGSRIWSSHDNTPIRTCPALAGGAGLRDRAGHWHLVCQAIVPPSGLVRHHGVEGGVFGLDSGAAVAALALAALAR